VYSRLLTKKCSFSLLDTQYRDRTGITSIPLSYDDLFETTTGTQTRSIAKSKWQSKAGFTTIEKPEEDDEEGARHMSQSNGEQVEDVEYEEVKEEKRTICHQIRKD
jgi:hypothetical protein